MKIWNTEQLLEKIQAYIGTQITVKEPAGLYNPILYAISLGGKRLRPMLMLLGYNLYKNDVDSILSQAVAIETYHNFTLLHDDLMDKADVRRNRPTVYKKWNENTAVLSGDAMLIKSYYYMMESCPPEYMRQVMSTFSKAALDVCEGQQYDMDFEKRMNVTVDEYIEMIRLKTSVLLAASLKIGAILGGASSADIETLYDFGIKMGLAFQLQDDYLDVYGDPSCFGKKIGGDILCNKKTYMLITALERTKGTELEKELLFWLSSADFVPEEKISAVVSIYDKVGIASACRDEIGKYYAEGLALFDKIQVDLIRKEPLLSYVYTLINRNL